MSEKVKADLDKLDKLRDLAHYGPEEKRDEAQQGYEEFRTELLEHEQCEACDDDVVTKELKVKDKVAESPRILDADKVRDLGWESNRDDENIKNLPWPEDNESKD